MLCFDDDDDDDDDLNQCSIEEKKYFSNDHHVDPTEANRDTKVSTLPFIGGTYGINDNFSMEIEARK